MTWTSDEKNKLKDQLLKLQVDLAIVRGDYPLQRPRDPNNMAKGIIADRLDQINERLYRIIDSCEHPESATEEKL